MEIKQYKGKHTLKIKLQDKTLSIEPDTALGVMQRGDKLYILHQQRNAMTEFFLTGGAAVRMSKLLEDVHAESINWLNLVRIRFNKYIDIKFPQFASRWNVDTREAKWMAHHNDTRWWQFPLMIDGDVKIECRLALIRARFYFIILFPRELGNMRYRINSNQIDAAVAFFQSPLQEINRENSQRLALGTWTFLPDTEMRRVMPTPQHNVAFMSTNEMRGLQ